MATQSACRGDAEPAGTSDVAFRAGANDLSQAVLACEFPIIVWALPGAVVRIANQPAADLVGGSIDRLLGRRVTDFLFPTNAVVQSFAALSSGAVDVLRAERRMRLFGGGFVPVRVWSKVVDLDGARAAVSIYIPEAEVMRLGREPSAPWRDLVPISVGTADSSWRITGVSAELALLIGRQPMDVVGTSLLALIHPDDATEVAGDGEASRLASSRCHVRLRHGSGEWVDLSLLVAPAQDGNGVAFALIGRVSADKFVRGDRVGELEMRLRQIGAEVQASGVLDAVVGLPSADEHPQLGELTSRQWEILTRLVRGERVPTIARELFIAQSTVRNHLAMIFRRVGVHSQAELIAMLTPRDEGTAIERFA